MLFCKTFKCIRQHCFSIFADVIAKIYLSVIYNIILCIMLFPSKICVGKSNQFLIWSFRCDIVLKLKQRMLNAVQITLKHFKTTVHAIQFHKQI